MTTRRRSVKDPKRIEAPPPTADPAGGRRSAPPPRRLGHAIAAPHSREEVEATYLAARDAWTAAMRRASSGQASDLASLAIAQEAYEEATAERERVLAGGRAAIPIEPEESSRNLDAVVGQELAWRRVRDDEAREPGRLSRLMRRLTGHR
ncbi:MAG: hypothetical protein ACRDGD_00665 [Candidatus Limnocylindria bacterium]